MSDCASMPFVICSAVYFKGGPVEKWGNAVACDMRSSSSSKEPFLELARFALTLKTLKSRDPCRALGSGLHLAARNKPV